MAGGRPQKLIDVDFVDTLRDLAFTWRDIAEQLEVGYSTLMEWKRTEYLPEADHGKKRTAEEYTDAALDAEMVNITSNKPSWGEVRVWGLLDAKGIRVTRDRMRASMKRVDPEGLERRKKKKLRVRREYDIKDVYRLVSLDGNFKLPVDLYVVGGIDEASRVTSVMQVTDTKHASVMLKHY